MRSDDVLADLERQLRAAAARPVPRAPRPARGPVLAVAIAAVAVALVVAGLGALAGSRDGAVVRPGPTPVPTATAAPGRPVIAVLNGGVAPGTARDTARRLTGLGRTTVGVTAGRRSTVGTVVAAGRADRRLARAVQRVTGGRLVLRRALGDAVGAPRRAAVVVVLGPPRRPARATPTRTPVPTRTATPGAATPPGPTAAPTRVPTSAPTAAPTAAPTTAPTAVPRPTRTPAGDCDFCFG